MIAFTIYWRKNAPTKKRSFKFLTVLGIMWAVGPYTRSLSIIHCNGTGRVVVKGHDDDMLSTEATVDQWMQMPPTPQHCLPSEWILAPRDYPFLSQALHWN